MNVKEHYDRLIEEDNDPFFDPPELQAYMDGWDGPEFMAAMQLDGSERVLEIGVGTGRLADRAAPCCRHLTGIDLSPKTIERAAQNLQRHPNVDLICGDFLEHPFAERFDVIYSSLTMMRFEDKQQVLRKVDALLKPGGRFCLSIDKNPSRYIDMGVRKLQIYPDAVEETLRNIGATSMQVVNTIEKEFAHILVCRKQ